jgi:hypothetical protein
MPLTLDKGLLVVGLSLWLVAVGCGIHAAQLGVSRNKGLFRMRASVLFAAGLCLLSLSIIVSTYKGKHFSIDGYVEEAHVVGSGRSRLTDVRVRAGSGDFVLRASDTSIYFRPGQHVILTYQEYSGSILKARFFSASGKQEGGYNNADFLAPSLCLLVVLFIIWNAVHIYGRDPEDAQESREREVPLNSVDEDSLLHLGSSGDWPD